MMKANGKPVSTAQRKDVPSASSTWLSMPKRMKSYPLSSVNVADNEALPTLLSQLRRRIEQVSADGAYDTKECHRVLQRKGAKPTIVPRSNAGYWEDGHPRNDAVKALKNGELKQWKKDNDYHQRSLSETSMYRYKQLNTPKLTQRPSR